MNTKRFLFLCLLVFSLRAFSDASLPLNVNVCDPEIETLSGFVDCPDYVETENVELSEDFLDAPIPSSQQWFNYYACFYEDALGPICPIPLPQKWLDYHACFYEEAAGPICPIPLPQKGFDYYACFYEEALGPICPIPLPQLSKEKKMDSVVSALLPQPSKKETFHPIIQSQPLSFPPSFNH